MNIFKGYIICNGKAAAESIKGKSKFKSIQEVENSDSYGGIIDNDYMLVDIDDIDQSENILEMIIATNTKCVAFETEHGMHFIFRKPDDIHRNKTRTWTPVGVKIDIKLGGNNSYEILKLNGVPREIILDDAPDLLPYWLYPIGKSRDFSDLSEGDGRNQVLFDYILNLTRFNFSKAQCKFIITLINKHIFKDPLEQSELNTILRDEAFAAPSFYGGDKGTTFLHAEFGKYLIANEKIVKINNRLHCYEDGVYVHGLMLIEKRMLNIMENLTKAKRNEVLCWMEAYLKDTEPTNQHELIAFNNGLYNIITKEFSDFNEDIIITSKIPYDYNPAASSKLLEDTINKLAVNDKHIIDLLYEVVGYCFYRRNELGKAFILTGDGSNGKSTFLDLIQNLLSVNNIASLDIMELGDRFRTAELYSKLANIGDDIGDEFIANPSVFKKLVTGDRITVERKGKDPFEFNSYAKMLFSANTVPRIKDKTGAIQRRLVIIPFNAKFNTSTEGYKPYIKYELRSDEVMQALIVKALAGLDRILENRSFTSNQNIQDQLDEYEEINNPLIGYIKDAGEELIINNTTDFIYRKYTIYCSENNLKAISKIELIRQLKNKLNLEIKPKMVDGKRLKLLVKIKDK